MNFRYIDHVRTCNTLSVFVGLKSVMHVYVMLLWQYYGSTVLIQFTTVYYCVCIN